MLKLNDTFERGGCLWIVENVYTTDNPELYYTDVELVTIYNKQVEVKGVKVNG